MPTGSGDERRNTLHGEPLPLPPDHSSPSDVAGGPVPPRRDTGWLVIAVAAAAVLVIGLGGLLAWMVVRDNGSDATPAIASIGSPKVDTTTAQATSTSTAPERPIPTTTHTQTPPAPTATWYAQFGAFNDYDNARAEAARHYGADVLPGAAFGLSSRYVVARPTESEAAAREVCSHFAEGTCYVRSR